MRYKISRNGNHVEMWDSMFPNMVVSGKEEILIFGKKTEKWFTDISYKFPTHMGGSPAQSSHFSAILSHFGYELFH